MNFEVTNLRLFGFDLGRTVGLLRQGWAGLLRWPFFSFLTPKEPVRVTRSDRSSITVDARQLVAPVPLECPALFSAHAVPGELCLFHGARLPHLVDEDILEALSLQVNGLSPFPADDTVWGWRINRVADEGLFLSCAMASRKQLQVHLESRVSADERLAPEIWAEDDKGFIVLKGFGEQRRISRARKYRNRMVVLALGASVAIAAIPAAHLLQVRARVFDAQEQLLVLQSEAAPFIAARDRLLEDGERAGGVRDFIQSNVNPVWMLETLTELLPDDAHLNRFDLDGRRVRIAGQAKDGAALMEALRARSEFAELRALSPITRGRDGLDVFNLELLVRPPGGQP